MKKLANILSIIALTVLSCSCNSFLDIVPDNVATIDNAFSLRTNAERYLFTCYSYIPDAASYGANPGLTGCDELTTSLYIRDNRGMTSWYIARGFQSPSTNYVSPWIGNGTKDLYQGIRDCNIFIENIDKVPDMEEDEKLRWVDEVKFLKAYYHFYLIRCYGPIPIKDVNLEIGASIDEVHVWRNTIDECFEYVVKVLDEVIDHGCLPDRPLKEAEETGRITKGIALAMKAEVLMYAASPLFCGNTDYRGYTDNRGVEIFCPEKTDAEKLARWQAAADACKEAIDFLENPDNGAHTLYKYESKEYNISDVTRTTLTIRQALTEKENVETVWGYTKTFTNLLQSGALQNLALLAGTTQGIGYLSVPLNFSELFYTKNGLPIDVDSEWDYDNRFKMVTATDDDYLLLKPGYEIPACYRDRELRFYSDLSFDGCSWFGNGYTDEGKMYYNTSAKSSMTNQGNENVTGLWPRKFINYKTVINQSAVTTETYPYPLLSMNSLYLYYAEALNETGASYSEVLPWVNMIRERAGVPDVATSWDFYSKNPGKYKTQIGLRDIIHRERTIELAFQGFRFWDQRRWKEAYQNWNCNINGWNTLEIKNYYKVTPLYVSVFDVKDYFWPIPNSEIFANENTVQNPGW